MLIVLAVTAPVLSAGPSAVAHCPTTTAADVADTFFVNVVFAENVTLEVCVLVLSLGGLELDFLVPLLVELLGLVGMTGTIPLTTKVEPEIEVTLPNAVEKVRARAAAPAGNVPPVVEPLGGRNPAPPNPAPPRNPAPPPNPAPPVPPNPAPRVHDPVELGWVIVTVVAVKLFEAFFDLVAATLVAVTQSPTASSEDGSVTVWVKFVEAVQVTVTWPLDGFCTSIEVPGTTAAMVPDAVENAGRGVVVGVVEAFFAAAPADPLTAATPIRSTSPIP
jgi:hypothetical protein